MPDNDVVRPSGIQSPETGLTAMLALARPGAPHMLKAFAEAAGMPASKAHRYIANFVRTGFAERNPSHRRYRLGTAALNVGIAALAGVDAVRLGSEAAARLCDEVHETVALAI